MKTNFLQKATKATKGLVLVLAAILWESAATGQGLTLQWGAPTGRPAAGYVVLHGTAPGAYTDLWLAHCTNCTVSSSSLPYGANYFTVMDWAPGTNGLAIAMDRQAVVVTNTPGAVLSAVILTGTNAAGPWSPFTTNHVVFPIAGAAGATLFKAGALALMLTNLITIPGPTN